MLVYINPNKKAEL